MIRIGVTAEEHVSTHAFFRQFPDWVARFHVYPEPIRGRDNFARFPTRFLRRHEIDLVHVKNYTVRNRVPWLVEHEHGYGLLPVSRKRLRLLHSDYCRALVFMSRYARRTATSFFDQAGAGSAGAAVIDAILARSTVIYPAVRSRDGSHDYDRAGPLEILFVGNEFVRKGGLAALEAFQRLSRRYPLRLTVISTFASPPAFRRRTLPGYPDHSVFDDRLAERLAALEATDESDGRVTILRDVSRGDVLDVHMPRADVFVAPTFADSFGIATLEAMAEGLPIVATNINAIPEIIDDEAEGLLIDARLPDGPHATAPLVDGALDMRHSWRQLRERPFDALDHVVRQLETHLVRLIEEPTLRRKLGTAARTKFERTFSYDVRNRRYTRLYREAVGG